MNDDKKVEEAEYRLEAVRRMVDRIEHKNERKEQLRASLDCGSIRYDKDRIQTSIVPDKLSMVLADVVDMEADIRKLIIRLHDIRDKEQTRINQLPDPNERKVLKAMYLDLEDIWTITDSLGYHVHSVYRIRRRGLINYYNMYLDKRHQKR